jgi:murein DD-endopeptidase MepM/ murein hydrolase activator NlpD
MRRLPHCKQPSTGLVVHIAGTFGLICAVLLGLMTVALKRTHREPHQVEAQFATLAARVSETKADLGQYKARLQDAAKRPQQLTANRDTVVSATDCPLSQIAEFAQKRSANEILSAQEPIAALKLVTLITPEARLSGPVHPEAVITDAPPEPVRDAGGITEPGRPGINEFGRVLASAGLNIYRLFSQFGLNPAEGGPFVPPRKRDQRSGIDWDKLEGIRGLIKSLPLSVPLEYFRLESRFGPRRDPFNRRPSFHTGLDLSAPYMSPIYATAPGIVTYAGYRGGYGRVVEIDHGNGIFTIYGHMHRYMVSVGQRVAQHAQIGSLGSTGRSSGPHVHYEILVNGEPQDPERFIALAPLVSVAERFTGQAGSAGRVMPDSTGASFIKQRLRAH